MVTPALVVAQQNPQGGQPQQTDQQRQQEEERQRQQRQGERQAADDERAQDQQRRQQGQAGVGQQDRAGQYEVLRADRLTGQTIRDRQGERIGRINDLALDTNDNRITHVLVNHGGMWGFGGEEVAVPWDQIQPDARQRVVRMESQQLEQARQVHRDQWPAGIGDDAATDDGPTRASRVKSVSNILGMDVTDRRGERLGTIDELAIARDGAVSYAVIAYGGFLGIGDSHIAVPWDRMEFDEQRESLRLDVTEQQFEQARDQQRFGERRGEAWPARVDWPFGGAAR
jgi:sporulation protein YlmC with PRC-barrel domain